MESKTRDNYFDNLRGFLIICVIVGNSLEYIYPTTVNPHYLILFLYMFHMPLFTFISGYFCKRSKRTTQQKVFATAKIYLFAQTFYFLFNKFVLGRTVQFQLLYPNWTLWYLLALMVWYLLSDYFHNYKKAFIISILVALLVGFDGSIGTYASGSRIFFFLPFFIAGLAFNKELFLEKYKKYTVLAGILVSIVLIILFLIRDFTDVEIFFEYCDYTFYLESPVYPFIMRIFHYIGGFIICSFMLLTFSSKRTIFSWLGKNSLFLYVSHAAVIQLMVKVPFPILKYDNWTELVLSELLILLTIIVGTYVYKKVQSYVTNSKVNSLNQTN